MALKEKSNVGNVTKGDLNYFYTGPKTLEIFQNNSRGPELWDTHKKKVLDDWIKRKPGSRPWAWWQFDSPVRPVNFVPLNLDQVEMIERHYICWGVTHRPGLETFPEPPYLFESEASYLKRKKLLIKGELKRISPADFEPKEFYPYFTPDPHYRYSRIDEPDKICTDKHNLAKYDLVKNHYPIRYEIPSYQDKRGA